MMMVKQLSVFLENRNGRLDDVLKALAENQINIVALSLADTSDFGVLRMMVSDPEKGRDILKSAGFTAMLTDVICIKVAHETGSLSKAMSLLLDKVGIEYMYAFANGNNASAVVRFRDAEKAAELLKENHVEVWPAEEVYAYKGSKVKE